MPLAIGGAVFAQPIIDETLRATPLAIFISDVTGDGFPDKIQKLPFDNDHDFLVISKGLPDGYFEPPLAFAFPIDLWGDSPSVAVRSDTSFTAISGCFACGRYHSHQTYTIAYRNDAFVVAGYTASSADRLNATTTQCDVNLLTGKAIITFDVSHDRQDISVAPQVINLADINDNDDIYAACKALDKYDNAFVERYVTSRDQ
ncbi:hypothetical protein GCM10008927_28180 [Amylibacter ulvae]|uniref:Uncharacterized protein n=1 Tax=Paramylibacter ulvae TaxID=1651968 RepID=A0ABQ3D6B8_9RHOB|nr:hypothetical protein GCM10008927_28180 [Amylibacter ulvae]